MKITEQEKQILNIIRKKEYTKIIVLKKTSNDICVYGESVHQVSNLSENDIIKLFEQKDFITFEIIKRDGKIVHYRLQDVYKI